MLYLYYKSITKGVVHYTPNAVYTLPGILIRNNLGTWERTFKKL